MSVKAYGEDGSTSSLVRGIQYAVEHHADVLSQSFMSYLYPGRGAPRSGWRTGRLWPPE
ncbi:hypothetical protein ABT147_35630 [Streptomyces sp. NPDC001868]|uniref:hypothetical protein n=1 Tax=Streptomyces sp. NPDC001868 TaxID=3154401 RepID=UPI00331FAD9B